MYGARIALTLVAWLAAWPALALTGPRNVTNLDQGWLFHQGELAATGSTWRHVSLPHSWNRIGSYPSRGSMKASELYQGVGWYERHFAVPAIVRSGHSFLEFNGASIIADVWLNGHYLGRHAGAYSRFRFDVTGLLRPTGNALRVRVDNSKPAPGSATADVLPLSGDFFQFGGLYRSVSLITTGSAHIDLMDHGGPGVLATTRSASSAAATIGVRARVRGIDAPVQLVTHLDDAQGHSVASTKRSAAADGDVDIELVISSPHLWQGRSDPYLYRLRTEIWRDGRLLDRVDMPYGIRMVRIDPEHGLFLNGRHLPLHGVSRHQDRLDVGWAMTAADQARDMAMIEELGANSIRMAHYQHAPEWYDLADRVGMIVWAEIPFVNQAAWDGQNPSQALIINAREQLTELIRQNQNRPGIVTWSVGNEVDLHALSTGTPGRSANLLKMLSKLARKLDPSRPTTFADCCEPAVVNDAPQPEPLADATDMIGYNRYMGWYYGRAGDLGSALDIFHARHPRQPLAVSEYGAGGAVSQHSDDPTGGLPDNHGVTQPEEYQAWLIEQSWPQIETRPWLWSSWVWTMFDFASPRLEGDSRDLNTKGLITADRAVRKDAFYYLQANWSDRPVLHLTGQRYVDRAYPVADVKAYASAPSAHLSINGRDQGARDCPGHICLWRAVHLNAGWNRVQVTSDDRGRHLVDFARWKSPDPNSGLALIAGSLLGGEITREGRFGSDHFFTGGEPVRISVNDNRIGRTARVGSFSYDLPVPAGRWRLSLWFAHQHPGQFSLSIDHRAPIVIDPLATARRDLVVVTHGPALHLAFGAGSAPAMLAALYVRPEKE